MRRPLRAGRNVAAAVELPTTNEESEVVVCIETFSYSIAGRLQFRISGKKRHTPLRRPVSKWSVLSKICCFLSAHAS